MAADQSSLSPIAACLRIAAQRGRALRLAREAAQRKTDQPGTGDDQPAAGPGSDAQNEAQPAGGISVDMPSGERQPTAEPRA